MKKDIKNIQNNINFIPKMEDENSNLDKSVKDIDNLVLTENRKKISIINPILNNSNSNLFNISNNGIQNDVERLPMRNENYSNNNLVKNSLKINHLELDNTLIIIRNNENDKEKNEDEKNENEEIENHKKCDISYKLKFIDFL